MKPAESISRNRIVRDGRRSVGDFSGTIFSNANGWLGCETADVFKCRVRLFVVKL